MLNLIGRKRLEHLVLFSYCFLANPVFSSDFAGTVNFSKFKYHERLFSYCFLANPVFSSDFAGTVNFSKFKYHERLFHNDKLVFMKTSKKQLYLFYPTET